MEIIPPIAMVSIPFTVYGREIIESSYEKEYSSIFEIDLVPTIEIIREKLWSADARIFKWKVLFWIIMKAKI